MDVRAGSDKAVRQNDEKKMRASVYKIEATSQRLDSMSRRSPGHKNLTSRR